MIQTLKIFILALTFFLFSCSKVQESAGVTRKSLDEFQVYENPSLKIPPSFNLLPPDEIEERELADLDQDVAKEILFGLDEDVKENESNPSNTIDDIIVKTNAKNVDPNIRNEINEKFADELNSSSIYQFDWENEIEVLDAIKESERLRNLNFENKSLTDGESPTTKQIIKNKKKKRFFIF